MRSVVNLIATRNCDIAAQCAVIACIEPFQEQPLQKDTLATVVVFFSSFLSTPACRDGRHAFPPKLSVHLVSGGVNGLFRVVNSLWSCLISLDAGFFLGDGKFFDWLGGRLPYTGSREI